MNRDAEKIIEALTRAGARLALAESCTGGMLSSAITDVPGASLCFEASLVTYSPEAKASILKVPGSVLALSGAVSGPAAAAMAEGALAVSGADIACSVTGVAGPGPDLDGNPAGLVYIACSMAGHETETRRYSFSGDRKAVRETSVRNALCFLAEYLAKRGIS